MEENVSYNNLYFCTHRNKSWKQFRACTKSYLFIQSFSFRYTIFQLWCRLCKVDLIHMGSRTSYRGKQNSLYEHWTFYDLIAWKWKPYRDDERKFQRQWEAKYSDFITRNFAIFAYQNTITLVFHAATANEMKLYIMKI